MLKHKRRVAVLRGGDWDRHEESLQYGGFFLAHMFENLYPKWQPQDIFIDRSGVWHFRGQEITPADLYHRVDVVWNVSDPRLGQVLDYFEIPYIGTPAYAGALKESREMLKNHIKNTKACLPGHFLLPVYREDIDGELTSYTATKAREVYHKLFPPYIVKPLTGDGHMAVHVAKGVHDLVNIIYDGAMHDSSLLIEELIEGKNCTVHCVKNFRGQDVYQMMPKSQIGDNADIRLSVKEKEKIQEATEELHFHFDSPNYVRYGFTLSSRGLLYLNDFDFHPEFAEDSHLSIAAEDLGLKTNHILEHILENALTK